MSSIRNSRDPPEAQGPRPDSSTQRALRPPLRGSFHRRCVRGSCEREKKKAYYVGGYARGAPLPCAQARPPVAPRRTDRSDQTREMEWRTHGYGTCGSNAATARRRSCRLLGCLAQVRCRGRRSELRGQSLGERSPLLPGPGAPSLDRTVKASRSSGSPIARVIHPVRSSPWATSLSFCLTSPG